MRRRRTHILFCLVLAGVDGINAEATTSSDGANALPKIIQQPTSITVYQGDPASFKIEIDPDDKRYTGYSGYTEGANYGSPTSQWMKEGARITGATSQTLTFASTKLSDAGTYFVVIANRLGWI